MIPWFDHVFDNFEEAYLETCLTSTTERLIVYDTIEKISNGFKGYVIYIFAIFVLEVSRRSLVQHGKIFYFENSFRSWDIKF